MSEVAPGARLALGENGSSVPRARCSDFLPDPKVMRRQLVMKNPELDRQAFYF